jgi:hypothetical protein
LLSTNKASRQASASFARLGDFAIRTMNLKKESRRMYPDKNCPCQKCRAHFEGRSAALEASLRATASDYTPPDPYRDALAAQRARDAKTAAARTYQPAALPPTEFPTDVTPPDSYKAALERLRQENKR